MPQHLPDLERRDPDPGARGRAASAGPDADAGPQRDRLDAEPPTGYDALLALARLLGRQAAQEHTTSQVD